MDAWLQFIPTFTWYEWSGFFFGLLYIIFAARNQSICWWFGLISCACWGYAAYHLYLLYLDTILQLIYMGMSIWGLMQWQKSNSAGKRKLITSMSAKDHLFVLLVGTSTSLLFGYLFQQYTSAAATYLDAFTTIFSLLTTLLVIYKKVENWIYWIVIDIAYVYLYIDREGYLFAILFMVYIVIAAYGYRLWKREMDRSII